MPFRHGCTIQATIAHIYTTIAAVSVRLVEMDAMKIRWPAVTLITCCTFFQNI